ncbi:hypothetical protein HOO54_13625 [Bacillus sp. WMMC1349]|uniref:hypothetical protein n=1 Tax=Bacillus sp. WMMC1349 TaxID=2736254 RepID=UPI0015535E6D|nr:hypothetical protein [Bacillus sp. WMMC1349]NPC93244.1 hypothetical protein [Bacillus sp. WMMC1349]
MRHIVDQEEHHHLQLQREVNKHIDDIIGTKDFALPGKIIDKKLHADHFQYGRF